jgi:hypothetical protein
MTSIDCAAFEGGLADLLADPGGAPDDRLAALRRHAEGCEACRGASDLVDLAARPAADRDIVPDPGSAYWADFDRRLAVRLRVTGPRTVRLRPATWAGLAIAVAAAAAIVVLLLVPREGSAVPIAASGRPPAAEAAAPVPPPEGIRSATPDPEPTVDASAPAGDDPDDGLAWTGADDPFAEAPAGALFPGVDGLSEEQRDRFAAWLRQEERRVRGEAA